MKFTKYLFPVLIFICLMTLPHLLFAQPPGDPGCSPDDPCPIDGGLSLLIAAGIGIAAKKAYAGRKAKAVENLD